MPSIIITRGLPPQRGTLHNHRDHVGQPRSKPPRKWVQRRHYTDISVRVVSLIQTLIAYTTHVIHAHLPCLISSHEFSVTTGFKYVISKRFNEYVTCSVDSNLFSYFRGCDGQGKTCKITTIS